MDLSETIVPKSDQTNADDFLAGPQTCTITAVNPGTAEQPVEIVLAEFGPVRPFKPSKTVRRVLVSAWGKEASQYVGRRMTLYCDPDVKWGGVAVGGIRVSHLSHLDKPLTLSLTTTRGKRAPFVVQPLADAPDMLSEQQSKRLHALLGKHSLGREAALELCSQETGRSITTTKGLSPAEASKIISALESPAEDIEQPPVYEGGES